MFSEFNAVAKWYQKQNLNINTFSFRYFKQKIFMRLV